MAVIPLIVLKIYGKLKSELSHKSTFHAIQYGVKLSHILPQGNTKEYLLPLNTIYEPYVLASLYLTTSYAAQLIRIGLNTYATGSIIC